MVQISSLLNPAPTPPKKQKKITKAQMTNLGKSDIGGVYQAPPGAIGIKKPKKAKKPVKYGPKKKPKSKLEIAIAKDKARILKKKKAEGKFVTRKELNEQAKDHNQKCHIRYSKMTKAELIKRLEKEGEVIPGLV